jgi:hypothetical protein
MKLIKINDKDYVIKFTAKVVAELNELEGITLTGLSKDLEEMKVTRLYKAFFYSLKSMQHDITMDDAYKLIDALYEEGMELEEFFKMVLMEYSQAMGLGKKFKEIMEAQA